MHIYICIHAHPNVYTNIYVYVIMYVYSYTYLYVYDCLLSSRRCVECHFCEKQLRNSKEEQLST